MHWLSFLAGAGAALVAVFAIACGYSAGRQSAERAARRDAAADRSHAAGL